MEKITPFLWFDDNAEAAVNFYTSVFPDSKTRTIARYNDAGAQAAHMPKGTAMTIAFELAGQSFTSLNAGPLFKFTPAISFIVYGKSAAEVQQLWDKLSEGATVLMPLDKYPFSEKYGWLQDKYGLSWQLLVPQREVTQKIVPSLMFVGSVCGKAEEAIHFYTSIFHDSKVGTINRYGAGEQPDKEGTVTFADFTLEGQSFAAMDSAREHNFNFNEAISLLITVEKQEEVDYYWNKLSAVPQSEQCGWLKDKYGVSWQVVPAILSKYLSDKDPARSQRVMQAMLAMKKIDVEGLKKAYNG